MKRYFNITLPNSNATIANFQNLDINEIDLLINSSVDMIYCSVLNEITDANVNNTILNLSRKIRPGGQIVFSFIDAKTICKNYSNGIISEDNFLQSMRKINNVYYIGRFEDFYNQQLSKHFNIINTELRDNNISISIQRNLND